MEGESPCRRSDATAATQLFLVRMQRRGESSREIYRRKCVTTGISSAQLASMTLDVSTRLQEREVLLGEPRFQPKLFAPLHFLLFWELTKTKTKASDDLQATHSSSSPLSIICNLEI